MPASDTATPPLTPAQRRELRAAAHHLDPVVMIGDAGLSPGVLAEADRALTAHELIKLRVFGDDRQQRREILATLCAELGCQPVQEIGKLLVVYRKRPPKEPREHVPKKLAALGAAGARARGARPAAGSSAPAGVKAKPARSGPKPARTGAPPSRGGAKPSRGGAKSAGAPIQRRSGAGPVATGRKPAGAGTARRRGTGRAR